MRRSEAHEVSLAFEEAGREALRGLPIPHEQEVRRARRFTRAAIPLGFALQQSCGDNAAHRGDRCKKIACWHAELRDTCEHGFLRQRHASERGDEPSRRTACLADERRSCCIVDAEGTRETIEVLWRKWRKH